MQSPSLSVRVIVADLLIIITPHLIPEIVILSCGFGQCSIPLRGVPNDGNLVSPFNTLHVHERSIGLLLPVELDPHDA